uniref:Ig-like domain-containing protein n=1 Tax=Cyanistes caeruleus TaxID=156563 RepID=A0A8C0Z8Z0_CYACU
MFLSEFSSLPSFLVSHLEEPEGLSRDSPFYPETGGFLGPPKTRILGIIGDRVVLPCQVRSTPIPEDFSVRWTFRGQSQRIPVSSYSGKGRREEPSERYWGRTEFFHGEFRAGNVSLLLRDVRSSDQGSYSCEVSFQDVSQEVLMELEVAGWCYSLFFLHCTKLGHSWIHRSLRTSRPHGSNPGNSSEIFQLLGKKTEFQKSPIE